MKKQTSVLIQVVLIVVLVLLVLATVEASAIPAPTPPPPQHVLLEDGGTVHILGDCHLTIDVNGRESVQVTCAAEK